MYRNNIKTIAVLGQICNSAISLALYLILYRNTQNNLVMSYSLSFSIGYELSAFLKARYFGIFFIDSKLITNRIAHNLIFAYIIKKNRRIIFFIMTGLLILFYALTHNLLISFLNILVLMTTIIWDQVRSYLIIFSKQIKCAYFDITTILIFAIFLTGILLFKGHRIYDLLTWMIIILINVTVISSQERLLESDFVKVDDFYNGHDNKISKLTFESLISQTLLIITTLVYLTTNIAAGVAIQISSLFFNAPTSVITQAIIPHTDIYQAHNAYSLKTRMKEFFVYVFLIAGCWVVIITLPVTRNFYHNFSNNIFYKNIVIGVIFSTFSYTFSRVTYYLIENILNGQNFLIYRLVFVLINNLIAAIFFVSLGYQFFNLLQVLSFFIVLIYTLWLCRDLKS